MGDSDFPRGWKHRNWVILCFACERRAVFQRFLTFGRGRKSAFAVFSSSAAAESLFFPFSARRPWPKRYFSCLAAFGRGRNTIFPVFRSSAVAETLFFLFGSFRPWPKHVSSHSPALLRENKRRIIPKNKKKTTGRCNKSHTTAFPQYKPRTRMNQQPMKHFTPEEMTPSEETLHRIRQFARSFPKRNPRKTQKLN